MRLNDNLERKERGLADDQSYTYNIILLETKATEYNVIPVLNQQGKLGSRPDCV